MDESYNFAGHTDLLAAIGRAVMEPRGLQRVFAVIATHSREYEAAVSESAQGGMSAFDTSEIRADALAQRFLTDFVMQWGAEVEDAVINAFPPRDDDDDRGSNG